MVMEGLHVAAKDAISQALFREVSVGAKGFKISYFFYTNDMFFLREWDYGNIVNLIMILNYFYLVTSIKINLMKSNLLGVGVSS